MAYLGVLIVQLILFHDEFANSINLLIERLIEGGNLSIGEFDFECFNFAGQRLSLLKIHSDGSGGRREPCCKIKKMVLHEHYFYYTANTFTLHTGNIALQSTERFDITIKFRF